MLQNAGALKALQIHRATGGTKGAGQPTILLKRRNIDMNKADKKGYPHYMLKEIYEQPEVIENTLK
ncbi:MAG: hypothetical protein GX918_06120, partial [Clostridiales bacterium]|nr:hypothetical protein [Clostridiales bacterium]